MKGANANGLVFVDELKGAQSDPKLRICVCTQE